MYVTARDAVPLFTARDAVLLCEAVGRRIGDAHEWEGAWAGAVREPDREYAWGQSRAEMLPRFVIVHELAPLRAAGFDR